MQDLQRGDRLDQFHGDDEFEARVEQFGGYRAGIDFRSRFGNPADNRQRRHRFGGNRRRRYGRLGLRGWRHGHRVLDLGRRRVDQYRLDALEGWLALLDPQFRFLARTFRRYGDRFACLHPGQQDIFVLRFEDCLGQLALAHFLPLVVAEHTDHRRCAQPDQSHLQFGHLDLFPTPPSGSIAHLQGFFDIHFHHARHAAFLHGDADQLFGHFHRDFIMGNEQELCCT